MSFLVFLTSSKNLLKLSFGLKGLSPNISTISENISTYFSNKRSLNFYICYFLDFTNSKHL